MSKQCQVILEELRKLKTHPTVDELYPIVKKVMPNISLATVYRNLNLLANQGVILRLEQGGSQKRFDGNTALHYHFRCQACGRIYDLPLNQLSSLKRAMEKIQPHEAKGYDLLFFGICNHCKKRKSKHDKVK